jgi:hypothetical protein
MNTHKSTIRRYRQILIASLLSSSSLIPLLPAIAGVNTPTPGTEVKNKATAEYTDDAAPTTPVKIESDEVKVTVAEIAGISAAIAGVTNSVYRSNTVYFTFKVYNEGNDPTQLFIPAKPSIATYDGSALLAAQVGQLKVVAYSDGVQTTDTAVTVNNLVNATNGSPTGTLVSTGAATTAAGNIPNSGSVPPGGYIVVSVPITVPSTAVVGKIISVTLGNTVGQGSNTNTPYVVGANGTGGNDLYTKDNTNGTGTVGTILEAAGVPFNGDGTLGSQATGQELLHRQEASATQTATVVVTGISISGTVYHDKNSSGATTPFTVFTSGETGTNTVATNSTNIVAVKAVLIDLSTNKVLQIMTVPATGIYSFSDVPASTNVKVILSSSTTIAVDDSSTSLVATLTDGWAGTKIDTTSFNSGLVSITGKDLGVRQRAKLVLVKRITKINGFTTNPNDGTVLTGVTEDTYNFKGANGTTASYVGNWQTSPNYLVGKVDAGKVKPGDTIEYTIYFLNNQGANASGVKICDAIVGDQIYEPGTMKLRLGAATSDTGLTDANLTTVDRAFSYGYDTDNLPSPVTVPTNCNLTGTGSGVAIEITGTGADLTKQPDLTGIPGATAPATPAGSYGLFRFTTKVKQ